MRSTIIALSGVLLLAEGCGPSLPSSISWESMGGPYAQNLTTLMVAERHPGEIAAATSEGEIFWSTDHGDHWSKRTALPPNATIYRILPHPGMEGRLYASTSVGLFVSTNAGRDWGASSIEGRTPSSRSTRVLTIDPWNPGIMYAGVKGRGIYKSSDDGTTWNSSNGGFDSAILALGDTYDIKINALSPDVVYAAVSGLGLVKSTDAGASWSIMSERVAVSGLIPTSIALNAKRGEILCFGTITGSIYKSTDAGKTWSPSRIGVGSDQIFNLAPSHTDPEMLYAGTSEGIIVSNDFGSTWQELSKNLPHIKTCVAVSPSSTLPALFVYGEGTGLQRSRDQGATWQHCDARLGGSIVSHITVDHSGEHVFAAVGAALLYYDVETSSWVGRTEGLKGGPILAVSFDRGSASTLHLGTSAGLFTTIDAGESWSSDAPGLRTRSVSFIGMHPIIQTRMYSLVENSLMASTDRGTTWMVTRPLSAKYTFLRLTYSPTNAGFIYAATDDHRAIVATTDGGFTWDPLRSGITRDSIVAVTLDDRNPQTCYAWASTGEAYRSTNAGIHWEMAAAPWTRGAAVRFVLADEHPSEAVAFVYGSRVYYTRSGGATWIEVPAALLKREVTALQWDPATATLYAGTKGTGVYRLPLRSALNLLLNE